ncbi:pectate lyase family protein [Cellulomonas sp. P5_E12]
MRARRTLIATLAAGALLLPATTAHAAPPPTPVDLGTAVLPPGDGWASYEGPTVPDGKPTVATGTTGGAAADAAQVYVVDTWQELRDALAGKPGGSQTDARTNTVPRIVYVTGTITAFDPAVSCDDYAGQVTVSDTGQPFRMADYIAHFDPAGPWGTAKPSGPLENARVAAAAIQAAQTLQHVGSNVTLVGVGPDAQIVGASMRIRDAHNVIVRNLTISDAYDCFPVWDPTDTAVGNWNSAYDNVSIWTSTSVWVDHNTFDDGTHPHEALPTVFGRPFEVHDGLLDITHGSDLVTVSYNQLDQHDKTELIGSSDSRPQDRGQHRVTIHHNHWIDIGQRAPRVRFGDVHVYDNLYTQTTEGLFQYYWGAGIESSIYAENNAFELAPGVDPGRIITRWAGTQLFETGSTVNGQPTDLLAAFNATAPVPLAPTARWNPADVYDYVLDPVQDVPAIVRAEAGAGVLASGTPVATGAPGTAVVSDDNGRDTGLRDGSYTVTANLWWGQNATVARLYENGALVGAQWLTGTTPHAQTVTFPVAGKVDGTYSYVVELLNPYGTSSSAPHTVRVTDAAPGRAVLSDDNRDGDGSFTVTTNLWWGTNATHYALYRDGALVDEQDLTAATPNRQSATTSVTGLAPGTYRFVAVLSNAAGSTPTAERVVTVRR